MGIDRKKFMSLAIAMWLAPACGPKAQTTGETTPVTTTPDGDNERMPPDHPADECIDWDAAGECIEWAAADESPADECVDWDAAGECIEWEDESPSDECVDWDPSGECIEWES
jgi:hypothetical protein